MSIGSTPLAATWSGLVDDAAIFPPGNAALPEAVRAYAARADEWYAGLVGPFVVGDVRLSDLLEVLDAADAPGQPPLPVTVVATGGAGAVRPAATWATRSGRLELRGLEIALRDLDDLTSNVRRVAAAVDEARGEGVLDDDTAVFVELPQDQPSAGWLAAADEVAANDFRLKFRTGGVDAALFPAPATLGAWLTAALDRETPFKCTAGLHHALPFEDPALGTTHHGFLNVLLATRASLDGAAPAEVAAQLRATDPAAVLATATGLGDALPRTRRWFTSFGCCSVDEVLEELVELDLLAPPTGGQ